MKSAGCTLVGRRKTEVRSPEFGDHSPKSISRLPTSDFGLPAPVPRSNFKKILGIFKNYRIFNQAIPQICSIIINMNQNRFSLWYFAVAITFIVLENLHFVLPALIAKAFIIPSLMVFYHFSVKGKYGLFHRLIMIGLFFSWLGDVILQLADDTLTLQVSPDLLFVGGLGSFLITQLIYLIAFSLPGGKNSVFTSRIYQTLLVVMYGCIILYFLYRSLGDMRVPVIGYTVIILLMLLAALNRYCKVNGLSYILVVIGAILFVISDSLIAINKFHMKINFA
jgi:uncharacterized membrane protein YhhN